MTSYVDDKSAACHDNFLSAESIPFCKGGSNIMGRVEVGALHMQSFRDSKVIKTNFNRRSTLFLQSSQKRSLIFYEFFCEVGRITARIHNVCMEIHA